MRPTVIRLIAGGALGVAFSISLTLPGSVVFPEEAPIRQLAAPEAPAPKVIRATRMVERPVKAPASPRVVVQRVYVPTPGPMRATSVVRHTPRSKPSGKSATRAPARVGEPVTPLAAAKAPPPAAQPADEPKQGDDEPRRADRQRKSERPRKADKPRKSEKPKKAKKPREHGSPRKDKPSAGRDENREQHGDDHGGHEKGEHGNGRGGRSDHG